MDREIFHSRQVVLDASLRLQVIRARYCDEWLAGRGEAEVHFFGSNVTTLRDWMQDKLSRCEELTAVTTMRGQTLEGFVPAHRYNQQLVRRGVRMTSYFDPSDSVDQVREFIIAADDMPYYFACGVLQVKALDGNRVIIEGPRVDGQRSVMLVRGEEVVNATRRYLKAVRDTAVRACEFRDRTVGATSWVWDRPGGDVGTASYTDTGNLINVNDQLGNGKSLVLYIYRPGANSGVVCWDHGGAPGPGTNCTLAQYDENTLLEGYLCQGEWATDPADRHIYWAAAT
jgi:hypothetical protein